MSLSPSFVSSPAALGSPVSPAAIVGIDVSKKTLACALMDAQTRRIVWESSLPNTPEGIRQLWANAPASAPCVLEPTGRYSLLAVEEGHQAGRTMLLAPTRAAKAFLNSLQSRAKTDRLDSRGLALFGLSQPLRPFVPKSEPVQTLQQHLAVRKLLSKSYSSLQQQQQELPHAASALQPVLDTLTAQIKALDKEIARLTKEQPAFAAAKNLQAVPGIGPVSAAALTSALASKSFARADQFVAYVGLDVGVHQSGDHKGQRGLTHQGDAELRRLLYLCAQANLRCKESPFKEQYQRERDKGLSSTAALCAVARKLARLCWSLHKHATEYEASRVTRAPEAKPKGNGSHETQTPALVEKSSSTP